MKKFIFTANVIALIALVPAIFIGYLHTDTPNSKNENKSEIVKEVTNGHDEKASVFMVKLF
jgi:hypothetical protein